MRANGRDGYTVLELIGHRTVSTERPHRRSDPIGRRTITVYDSGLDRTVQVPVGDGWDGSAPQTVVPSLTRTAQPQPGADWPQGPERDWLQWVARVGIETAATYHTLVAEGPDPAHPAGLRHALLDPPKPFKRRFRVLHAFNGTRDRTGLYPPVLLIVPARSRDPLEAAASSYGIPAATYAALKRRV